MRSTAHRTPQRRRARQVWWSRPWGQEIVVEAMVTVAGDEAIRDVAGDSPPAE